MSSSFGSSQGTIRYRIEVDQGNFNQAFSNFNRGMQQTNTAMMNTSRQAGALSNNFRTLGGGLPTTPLGQFQTQAATLPTTFDKTGKAADKAGGKMASFGEKFRGNKGLVFGAAGLSSAMAEAVGMLDMFAMASAQASEATEKVNQLTAQGITEGKEYSQAINEQTKAEKFLSMARRNTMLSMMDNVFFGTMVISQLTSMNLKAGILGKTFGKLKDFVRSSKVESMAFSGALGNMEVGFQKAGKGAQFLGMSLKSIGIIGAIATAITLAGIAISHFTQKAEASTPGMAKVSGQFEDMSENLKEFTDQAKEAAKDYGLSVNLAFASQEITKLSKKLGELKLAREEALRPKHIGRATQKVDQAEIDRIDAEIAQTEKLLNKNVELAQTIDKRERALAKLIPVEEQLARARDEDLAKNALRKKNEEDGIKRAGDASKAIQDLTSDVLDLSKGYNELSKVNKQFNETLNVTSSAGTSAIILGIVEAQAKLAPKVSGTTIEIQRLNNEMLTISNERAPQFRDAQISALEDLKAKHSEAVKHLRDVWTEATSFINNALEGPFEKFKTPVDKLEKKLKNDLKKTFQIFPEAKDNWKFIGKEEEIRARLESKLKTVFEKNPITGDIQIRPNIDMDDESWDDYGKQLLKIIDKKIAEGDTEMTGLREKIKKAIDNSDTAGAFTDLMNDPAFIELMNPTMEITIAQNSIDAIETAMTNAIIRATTNDGKGYPIKTTGFEMNEGDWEAAGLGEGSKYPGDHPPTFSSEWSKLTPEQQRKLRKMGLVNQQKPPDSIDDSFYAGPGRDTRYVQPRFMWDYDQAPHYDDKKGNRWVRDPLTGRIFKAPTSPFSRSIMPDDPSVGRLNNLYPTSFGGAIMGMGGSGTTNQKFGSYNISDLQKTGVGGAATTGAPKMNELDKLARQIQQITSNLNTFARATVQVTKNISQWARATSQQTQNNDQLARTIAQLTKNNDINARTTVTVTKDLNQLARATSQNTKNNNTFAKTIVQTTKDFDQMARGVNQNTKNLNTFARAVKQSTSNVKELTNALNGIPSSIKVGIKVGLSGPGSPFIEQLI